MDSIANLLVGETAVVAEVLGGSHQYRKRLFAAGVIPGASVKVSHKAPFGDLIKIIVGNSSIAIRSAEAAIIKITKIVK